jgi:hypothetical protein
MSQKQRENIFISAPFDLIATNKTNTCVEVQFKKIWQAFPSRKQRRTHPIA